MLKLMGILAVVTASTGVGMGLAISLKKRMSQLEWIIRMILEIENTIRFQSTDINSIIIQLNEQQGYKQLTFLPVCQCNLQKGQPLQHALADSVDRTRQDMDLKNRDTELLKSFLLKLGTTDLEGQIKNCLYYENLFKDQLEQAKTAYEQKNKLYCFLGLFAGVTFALFVL